MAQSNSVSISDLIDQYKVTGAAEVAQRASLDKQESDLNASVDRQTGAITREAELTGAVQSAIDQLLLDKSVKNKKSAAEFGTNQDAQTYVLGKLGERQIANSAEIIQSAKDIAEQQQVGFFDDPWQWVTNQFSLPRQVYAHNAKVAEQEVIENTISKLQNQTEASVRINNSIEANTSTDIMRLNSERLMQTAVKEVERTKQAALTTNMHIASVRLATNQQAFTNVLSLNRAEIDLQQLQISRENLGMQRELRTERLRELEERHKSDVSLQEDLDRATQLLGMRKLTPQQFKLMSGPMKDTLQFAMADPSMSQGRIAPDPVFSVERANIVNAPLTPDTQRVKSAIANLMITAQTDNPQWAAFKPEQKHELYLKAVKEGLDREMKNVPDERSIFSAPPMVSLGKIPAVAATQLWKEFVSPLANNPLMPTSSQQMFGLAGTAVVDGKMSLEKAASDLTTVYKAAVADNWHNRDYGRFSITVPEKYRTSYNTMIKVPGALFGDQIIDLTNETDVKNKLLRYINAAKANRSELGSMGNEFGM